MKNVVIEIQGKHAVLMNSDGDFMRVKNKDYTIGQRIETGKIKQKAGFIRWVITTAAAIAILFGGGAYAYFTPYTDESFDINPSIELSTNIFNTVIGVNAMNGDAERLLQKIELKDCDMQTAMSRLVDELINEGYLTPEKAAEIMVTTSSQDQSRAKTMLQDMIKALNREMDKKQVHANVQGECINNELKTRAQEYGVSPGKLRLAEQFAQSTGDPTKVNIQDWLNKSVKDILAAINANKEQSNGDLSANGEQKQEGYTGGDLNENGYNGGDQSSNGQNAGSTDQNGYLGGDQSNNGYNGGEDINNDQNSETPKATNSKGNSSESSANKGNTTVTPDSGSGSSETTGNNNSGSESSATNSGSQGNTASQPADQNGSQSSPGNGSSSGKH